MQRNESLRWLQILATLRRCTGERVRIRSAAEVRPAGELATRPTAHGTAFTILDAETATTRAELVERVSAGAKDASRFRGAASARFDGAYLPIDAIRDETDEDGSVWTAIVTRRPKLGYNPSESTVLFKGGRSKPVRKP